MADIEVAFKAMVDAALSVGSPPAPLAVTYPQVLPQGYTGEQTAVTYQVITAPRDYTQEGADGVTTFRVQTDVWGTRYDIVRAARNAMADAMSGAYNQVWAGLKVQGCFLNNESDNFARDADTPGPRLFRKTLDWLVTAEQR